MAPAIDETAKRLRQRASNLESLSGKNPHVEVERRTMLAAATLRACAQALQEVAPATAGYVRSKGDAYDKAMGTKPDTPAAGELERILASLSFLISASVAVQSYETIVQSADDIANGRDVDALKKFALQAGMTVGSVAATMSGLETAKALAEIASVLRESFEVGRVPRLKKHQAHDASEFLRWIEAVTAVGAVWLGGVEAFLRVARHQRTLTEAGMTRIVAHRVKREIGPAA